MKEVEEIKINYGEVIPSGFSGKINFSNNDFRYVIPAPGNPKSFLNHRTIGPCTTCKLCKRGKEEQCVRPGPAIKRIDGTLMWFVNGLPHRDESEGPANIYSHGKKEWFFNGVLHRINGPAVMDKKHSFYEWCFNGVLHRDDGPAVSGRFAHNYWLHGVKVDILTFELHYMLKYNKIYKKKSSLCHKYF